MTDTQVHPIKEAGTIDKIKSLAEAGTEWAKGGFHTATTEQFHHRYQFCLSCPYWDAEKFLGKGGCKICGCSVLKLYSPQSSCPHDEPRWLRTDGARVASHKAVPLPGWLKDQ